MASVGEVTRRTARNAAVMAVAEVTGKVATFAWTVVAARQLSQGDFGAFAFALSLAILLSSAPSWGFDPLLVQRASAEPARLPQLLSETLVWRALLAVPLFVVAGTAGALTRPDSEAAWALVLVFAATFLELLGDAGRAAAAGLQRQAGTAVALVVQRILTAALAVAALVAGMGLLGLAAAYFTGAVGGTVVVTIAVRRLGVRTALRSVTRGDLADTGRRSIAIGVDSIVAMVLFRVDAVLLGIIKDDAAVGAYAVAYRLVETVMFLSWTVAKAVFPVMSGAREDWRVRRGIEQGIAVVSLVYVPFAVVCLVAGPDVLRLLFGDVYAATSAAPLRWLAFAPLLFAMGYIGGYGLIARERNWDVLVASGTAALVNVVVNLALIPSLAGTGAAIATTVSYAVETAVVLVLVSRVVGVARLDRVLAQPAIAGVVMAVVLLVVPGPVLVALAAAGAAYAVVWFAWARARNPDQLAVLAALVPGRGRDGSQDGAAG